MQLKQFFKRYSPQLLILALVIGILLLAIGVPRYNRDEIERKQVPVEPVEDRKLTSLWSDYDNQIRTVEVDLPDHEGSHTFRAQEDGESDYDYIRGFMARAALLGGYHFLPHSKHLSLIHISEPTRPY